MSVETWRGSVLASGFVFDERLLGRAELVRRLLGAWADRARLARAGERWYLLGITPRQVDSRACIGAPLVLVEGRWLMGPTPVDALRAAPIDSILECVGGERCTTAISSLAVVHPSELIELELPAVLEVELLAPPPQPVVVSQRAAAPNLEAVFAPMLAALSTQAPPQTIVPQPVRPTLRARLGAWLTARAARPPRPSLGARLGGFFASLATRLPSTPQLRSARRELDVEELRRPPPTPREPSWFDRVNTWLGSQARPAAPTSPRQSGLLDRLGTWLTPTTPPPPPRDPPPPARAEQPGWLATAFRNFFSTPATPEKQREYLDDLRHRFSRGDLAEALRRAVPLGGGASLATGTATIPARRDHLSLFSPAASGGAPSMVMPTDEYAAMKKLYRESADALIAKGQIEEAAYVLAKLLLDGPAAVALLEKHGCWRAGRTKRFASRAAATTSARWWERSTPAPLSSPGSCAVPGVIFWRSGSASPKPSWSPLHSRTPPSTGTPGSPARSSSEVRLLPRRWPSTPLVTPSTRRRPAPASPPCCSTTRARD